MKLPGSLFKYSSPFSLCSLCTPLMLAISMAGLSACGGGGGGSSNLINSGSIPAVSNSGWQSGVFKASSTYANKCRSPRTGIDPETGSAYLDTQGTLLDENNFLRSWTNETYLWYNEVADRNPVNFSDPLDYFDVLKTTALLPSGKTKDRPEFHFTYPTSEWYDLSVSGTTSGYGFHYTAISETVPRNVVVAYVEPGSPAANAGLVRGEKIISVDGIDFINDTNTNDIDLINEAFFPSFNGAVHTFEVQKAGASSTEKLVMQSATITTVPVQHVNVIDTPTGKVGYFLFNEHIDTAEQELMDAINQLSAASIKDLVLDLRYNGGGALYLASELAYMIAGNTPTRGKIFENEIFNDKHQTKDIFGNDLEPTPFYNTSTNNISLPSLNLSRVFVITSGGTCSASEAIINGLRGVNVKVIQIGSTTCGKPYGFFPQNNCGTTYFSIQMKGVNNKGYGDYVDGFSPANIDDNMASILGCKLGDDFTHELGDPAEKNFAAALSYQAQGSCPAASLSSSAKLQKMSDVDLSNVQATIFNKEPGLMSRILRH